MRVTNKIIADTLTGNIQTSLQQLARTQQEIATGKRVNRPGDDPAVVERLMNLKSSLEGNQQYLSNIDDGLTYLDSSEQTLGSAVELLRQAQSLAVQGSNGTVSKEDMQLIKTQVDHLIDNLMGIANTSIGNRYIFAGKDNTAPPFERQGDKIIYKGGFTGLEREILFGSAYQVSGPGVNFSGGAEAPFGQVTQEGGEYVVWDGSWDENSAPHDSVFSALFNLRNAMDTGDQAKVSETIGRIETQNDYLLQQRIKIGTRVQHFEAVKDLLLDQEILVKQSISNIEDVDIEKASIDLARQQLNYQGALAAGAMIMQTSLLQFLQ